MTKIERIKKSLQKLASSNAGYRIKLRAKPTKSMGQSIYLDLFIDGKRQYDYLKLYLIGDATRDAIVVEQALKIRNMRESELVYKEAGIDFNNWKKKSDIKDFIRTRGKSKGRIWMAVAKALDDFHPAPLRFTDVDLRFAEAFKDHLQDRLQPSSVWAYINCLKAAMNLAVKEQILFSNPINSLSVKRIQPDRVFLTDEEVRALQKAKCTHPEIKRAFLFACFTGLRISDIIRLDWASIDYQGNNINLRMKKTDTMLYVPIIEEAKKLLREPSTGKVFELPSLATINYHLKAWARSAGINKNISFHTARHTFAILGIDAGLGIHVIQKLLGHSAIDITMVYAKVRDKNLKEAANKLQNHFNSDNGE